MCELGNINRFVQKNFDVGITGEITQSLGDTRMLFQISKVI